MPTNKQLPGALFPRINSWLVSGQPHQAGQYAGVPRPLKELRMLRGLPHPATPVPPPPCLLGLFFGLYLWEHGM